MAIINKSYRTLRNDGPLCFVKKATTYILRKTCVSLLFLLLVRHIISLFPRDENLWVLGDGNCGRSRRGQNAKYFFLQQADRGDDVRIVWVSQKDEEIDMLRANGYTAYNSRSWKGVYRLLRAERIFCTNGMDFTWWLTGGADIVQLWHGNGLKYSGWDLPNRKHPVYRRLRYKHVTYNWDYFITTSKNPPSDIQRRAFCIDEKDTWVTGFPRTDIFFKDIDHLGIDVDTSLLSYLDGLSSGETVFMYAPTWRRDYRGTDKTVLSEADLDLSQLDSRLEENDSYLVLKIHPMEDVKVDQKEFNRILVAEPGSDPYPLLKRVDCLIADYSSIFIDYFLLNRPIIFFPYDLEEYTENEGLYYKYEAITPGDIVKSDRDLYDSIERIAEDNDPYKPEREVIRNLFYDHIDGNSAERIYQRVDSTPDR